VREKQIEAAKARRRKLPRKSRRRKNRHRHHGYQVDHAAVDDGPQHGQRQTARVHNGPITDTFDKSATVYRDRRKGAK